MRTFFIFLLVVSTLSPISTQETSGVTNTWSGFLGFGGTIPVGDVDITDSISIESLNINTDITLDIDAGENFTSRIGGKYLILEWLAVGGSFDYSGVKLDEVSYGNIKLINRLGMAHTFSILIFAEFRYNTGSGIMPYCQLGGGVNFNYFDAKPDIAKNLLDEKHSPAFHVALGCEFFTTSNCGIFFEIRYLYNDSDWDIKNSSAELCALNLRNIDLQNNVIVLNPGQTKGNRLRVVPMAGKAREIITRLYQNAMADGREILFVTRDLTPQTGNNLYHRLLRVLRKLPTINKQGVNIHTCRKTYISQAVMAGADPTKIMAIVGHQDWATMRVYLALSPAYLAQQINLPF